MGKENQGFDFSGYDQPETSKSESGKGYQGSGKLPLNLFANSGSKAKQLDVEKIEAQGISAFACLAKLSKCAEGLHPATRVIETDGAFTILCEHCGTILGSVKAAEVTYENPHVKSKIDKAMAEKRLLSANVFAALSESNIMSHRLWERIAFAVRQGFSNGMSEEDIMTNLSYHGITPKIWAQFKDGKPVNVVSFDKMLATIKKRTK